MQIEPVIYSRDRHNISREDIDSDALKIMYRLLRHGYLAFLVGGGVRDLLLGKKPKDFDVSTDATPKQVKSLFGNCRIIGRRFKLAHIFFHGGKIIEVSTFRDSSDPIGEEDAEENGKKTSSDNRFGTPETDALRRDLTINGLFYDLSNFAVIDYVGGMQDLKSGIVRMIGEPVSRIAEDPVRIIRALRHAARAGFKVAPDLQQAIQHNTALITTCSSMRVYEELKKDLCSGYAFEILNLLGEYGVLGQLWPEMMADGLHLNSRQSKLAKTLNRIDALLLATEAISITAILSALTLILIENSKNQSKQESLELTREDIADGAKNCFSKLAVPKKERLRIEDVLRLWMRLLHHGSRIKLPALTRHPQLGDLQGVAKIFDLKLLNPEAAQLLLQASKNAPKTTRFPMHARRRTAANRPSKSRHNDRRVHRG